MGTPFLEIYRKVVTEIDDPMITKAFERSLIEFCKIMYNFLDSAIPCFTTPTFVIGKLSQTTGPLDNIDNFVGDGTTTEFTFSTPIPDGAFLSVTVNGANVEYTIDTASLKVTLSIAPAVGDSVEIEWYDSGSFNVELNAFEKNILSSITVYQWAIKEENYLLDIRRIVQDGTYKMHDASRAIKSKTDWTDNLREKWQKEMNNYSYNLWYYNNTNGKNLWSKGRDF